MKTCLLYYEESDVKNKFLYTVLVVFAMDCFDPLESKAVQRPVNNSVIKEGVKLESQPIGKNNNDEN